MDAVYKEIAMLAVLEEELISLRIEKNLLIDASSKVGLENAVTYIRDSYSIARPASVSHLLQTE